MILKQQNNKMTIWMEGRAFVEISDKNKSDYSILLLFDIQLRKKIMEEESRIKICDSGG